MAYIRNSRDEEEAATMGRPSHANVGGAPDPRRAGAVAAGEYVAAAVPPYRTISAQRERILGLRSATATGGELFTGTNIPTLSEREMKEILPRLQYAVAYENNANNEFDFMGRLAEDLHKCMSKGANTMPREHVNAALFDLTTRSMLDTDAKAAPDIYEKMVHVAMVEEVPGAPGARQRRFRMVVSKAALDQIRTNSLCIETVLNKMHHRYSKVSYNLLNSPMRASKKDAFLPQLAAPLRIPHHEPGCAAAESGSVLYTPTEAASSELDVFSGAAAWPYATDAAVTPRCSCFRRRVIRVQQGCSMPPGVFSVMSAVLRGPTARAGGLGDARAVDMACPYEELAWVAHVRRLVGRDPHTMTRAELAEVGLDVAHPSSRHWVVPLSAAEHAGGNMYPYHACVDYQSMVASRVAALAGTSTARRDGAGRAAAGPDLGVPPIVRRYEADV